MAIWLRQATNEYPRPPPRLFVLNTILKPYLGVWNQGKEKTYYYKYVCLQVSTLRLSAKFVSQPLLMDRSLLPSRLSDAYDLLRFLPCHVTTMFKGVLEANPVIGR